MQVKEMPRLENMVCPWIGCGGTILGKNPAFIDGNREWICNVCGTKFVSMEDYQEKLKRESEWAEAWCRWVEEDGAEEAEAPSLEIEVEGGGA